mgnify:CR=1 FL=1
MAKNVNIETIQFKLQDFGKLKSVEKTFNKLNKSLGFTPKQINESIKSITAYDKRSQRSVNTFNRQIAALRELQNSVAIGGKAYKAFGAEADRLRAKLEALTGTQKKAGFFGKASLGAQAAGGAAVGAAASRFLPAGAATGASIGAIAGGVPGAAAGAAIGLGVDAIAGAAQFGAESAAYAAEIQKLQIALKGVTKNQGDFAKGLDIISTTSKRLNVPLAASTRQFTTLSASVLGAGGTIEQAETVFTGVSNAIKATGGNAEDVQSAIRAMSQIFGKGKVSAEELQGQLGERLAGAVVKFAEANGSSLAKLQKDLRDGTVGLDQVIKFAQKLNIDFADTANKVANSSADAGQRLKTTMDRLKNAVGQILQPIGAEFQRVFGNIVGAITDAIEAFNKFLGIGLGNAIAKTEKNIESLKQRIENSNDSKVIKRLNTQLNRALAKLAKLQGTKAEGDEGGDGGDGGLPPLESGTKSPLQSFADTAFKITDQVEQAFVNAFKGMEDALVKFVLTGKLNFRDLANSILADLTRMLVRAAITKPLFGFLFPNLADGGVLSGGKLVKSAKGNVFAKNKIVPYASGGIVNKPTLFPMANGMGLMGEAGPEAVMPLKRGANGKLGVQSSGGVGNIVVNVDASGSSVQGDSAQSEQFGRALAAAIQSELVNQRRPGGLLS